MNFIKMIGKPFHEAAKFGKAVQNIGNLGKTVNKAMEIISVQQPSPDDIIVICDGEKAREATKNIVRFLYFKEYPVCLITPEYYWENQNKLSKHKVIIVGHHNLADQEKRNVKLQFDKFGMRYGTSCAQCVLWVSHKSLSSTEKAGFAVYYKDKLAQYMEFADDYGVPLYYGLRSSTKKSQYDLLWVIFAKEALSRFLGEEEEKPPPKGGDAAGDTAPLRKPASDLRAILADFKEEAPGSSYVTADYLQKFCQRQRKFVPFPKAAVQKHPSERELLLERDGWQILRLTARDLICVLSPNGQYQAAGTTEQILCPILNYIHAQVRIDVLRENHRLEYGIVFSGGGARGAFQIGVWKWLEEHGLAGRFTGIAGASVGALNTLLFAQGSYEKAERIWMSMEDGDLSQVNASLYGGLADFLAGRLDGLGCFSRDGLERIIQENISLQALEDKLACVSLSAITEPDAQKLIAQLAQKYSSLKELDLCGLKQEVQEILSSASCLEYTFLDGECAAPLETNVHKVLASAAYPGAYTPVKVDGNLCIDGGLHDNVPVRPLVEAGFQKLLVIHLSPWEKTPEGDGAELWQVYPQEELGELFKINPELTAQRMQAGYRAAACSLKDINWFCRVR